MTKPGRNPEPIPPLELRALQFQFHRDGHLTLRNLVSAADCHQLACQLTAAFETERGRRGARMGGLRNLLADSTIRQWAEGPLLNGAVSRIANRSMFPVRALFFDKTAEANWQVPWHQDLSVAVEARREVPGFGGWSVKDGVLHVQPPAEILADMITLRLHLDDCPADNGALRVISGSHLPGRLDATQIAEHLARPAVTCEAAAGDAVLMCPLLLHSSLPSTQPAHRRVLHVEYAGVDLPGGLRWHDGAHRSPEFQETAS
jgi:hypothetical protein